MAKNSSKAAQREEISAQLREMVSAGEDVFKVTTTKLNEHGNKITNRQDLLTLNEIEDREDWCAKWGGDGIYTMYVYDALGSKRQALQTFKVKVTRGIPPATIDQMDLSSKAAVHAAARSTTGYTPTTQGTNAVQTQLDTFGRAPNHPHYNMPFPSPPGAAMSYPFNPYAMGQYMAQPQQQQDPVERLREELAAAKLREERAKMEREAEQREARLRDEMRQQREDTNKILAELRKPPEKNTTVEMLTAMAPLLVQMLQQQAAQRAEQSNMLMSLMSKNPLESMAPMLTQMETSRREALEIQKQASEKDTEFMKIMASRADAGAENFSKILMANAQASQVSVAMMGQVMEMYSRMMPEDDPLKEGFSQLMDLLGGMMGAVGQIAIEERQNAAKAQEAAAKTGKSEQKVKPEKQLPSAESKGENAENKGDDNNSPEGIAAAMRQELFADLEKHLAAGEGHPEDVALRVYKYMTVLAQVDGAIRETDPFGVYSKDPIEGTRQLLGGFFAQYSTLGEQYLQAILDVTPDVLQNAYDEAKAEQDSKPSKVSADDSIEDAEFEDAGPANNIVTPAPAKKKRLASKAPAAS